MISYEIVVFIFVNIVSSQSCYWNDGCAYQLFSSKTPYDAVRGDIRDYPTPPNCKAVALWSLNRHGNRNPDESVIGRMRAVANLQHEIVSSHHEGKGQLCAQDIEDLKRWRWNETLDVSISFLTGVGYEELYEVAKRLREKYPHLAGGEEDDYYFRSRDDQVTMTSAKAFVHGWTEGGQISLPVDEPLDHDIWLEPYQYCERYQQDVKKGQALVDQLQDYFNNPEFLNVKSNVQTRLGISTQLSSEDVDSLYELCRFYRSWEPNLKSPWCAAFSNADLLVMEYRDDVKHYYRNGYGSWVNVNLGAPVLKNLYENFENYLESKNTTRTLTAYFAHDTLFEMALCAMGLYKDSFVLQGSNRDPDRMWRTSFIGGFSNNILAVLSTCNETGGQNYRVQVFVNEKVTDLCPLEGCTWEEFDAYFQRYTTANLDFCSMNYTGPVIFPENPAALPDGASTIALTTWMLTACLALVYLR
ncbi:multiple inositol polyphosphate phosphatase 1-like [Ostrinia furnacalis]|uniref:multiple inositol polyphosphate phosphatase 1-like n=1 Tax=Ostrinia furnacalis TaxID=93504 RepID=UPI0010389918|nr:multiple inositol polyphosphate phosphatase 1-like [Ostrinia furnacalis]